MATLIFDIETVGERWGELDVTTQSTLSRWIDRTARTPEEREMQLQDLKEGLGFSPLTGYIVALGLYDLERRQGCVYYTGNESDEEIDEGDFTFKQRSEGEMLEEFWDGAQSYDTFVTFNGRIFDVPFVLHRSVTQGVKPTADIMTGRYLTQQKEIRHVDLQDQLTFYGAMSRRPNLHLFCRAYGIESPKSHGVGGDDVAELFRQEKFRDIATYNMHDVIATTKLYEKWLAYLAPPSFLNTIIE